MDLAAHFRIIGQNWLRILLISLAISAVVFIGSSTRPETFAAREVLAIVPGDVGGGQTPAEASSFLAQSYAEYADTPAVLRQALQRADINLDVDEAAARVSARAVGELGFVQVRATGPTRASAERLTRAIGQSLITVVNAQQQAALTADLLPIQTQRTLVQEQLASSAPGSAERSSAEASLEALNTAEATRRARPSDRVTVLAGAVSGDSPVSPQPVRDALLAFIVAVVVVSELTVLAYFVGDRFARSDDTADVTRITGLPVLAKIPRGSGIEVVEAFRILRTNLMVLEGAGKPRTVAVVSANQAAGKTFTAVHLAQSAAGLDEKVVLIDSDLRKPAIHERLEVPRAPGLSSVLQGGDLASALRKVPDTPYLRVLPSGAPVQDASAVLGARAFRHVLDALRAVRLVVVDTPPAGLFADAMAIASQCDATIFVLDVKNSRRRQVRTAVESLERAGANLIGVVVNRTTAPRRASYYET